MEKKNSILVIEKPECKLHEWVQKFENDLPVEKTDIQEAEDVLRRYSPEILILDLDHYNGEAVKFLDRFVDDHPETYWVLSASQISTDALVDFMRVGVRDFLAQPVERPQLEDLLERNDIWQSRKDYEKHRDRHQMISFFSPKGGVGVSMVAMNLAVSFSRRKLGRILLADFVLQHGNLAEYLDVTSPVYTLSDLAKDSERLDAKLLERSIESHRLGMSLLCCPKEPEEAEYVSVPAVERITKMMKQTFNYVMVDAGHELTSETLACLDASETIFVVTTPDLPSLCNVKKYMQVFKKLNYPDQKVKLLLNRWHAKMQWDDATVTAKLGHPFFARLSDDPELVSNALNQGRPLRELNKHAPLAREFEKLAEQTAALVLKEAAR